MAIFIVKAISEIMDVSPRMQQTIVAQNDVRKKNFKRAAWTTIVEETQLASGTKSKLG